MNNKKKLLLATCSLLLSMSMLGVSTFAWFTMSREVDVTNIQMTATTPEDIQISLGTIYSAASGATASTSQAYSLAKNTGYLYGSTAPREDVQYDWSNLADISAYYTFGKLIPASSTTGVNIYYTPDAEGLGRTVKTDAAYYAAVEGTTIIDNANATAYQNQGAEWSDYTQSTGWNTTNDDGYYIDIPVWLRTSSSSDVDIYVTGYVVKGESEASEADEDEDNLYQAARVAVLNEDLDETGILTLKDGSDYFETLDETEDNILDSDNYNSRQNPVLTSGIYALSAASATWDTIVQNDGSVAVGTLAAGTGAEYGDASRFIIRVWLEGEDGNCWNSNAGQDWSISLRFMREPLE